MSHFESQTQESAETFSPALSEAGRTIAGSREKSLSVLSKANEGSEPERPFNLNLSTSAIASIRRILKEYGNDREKTAKRLEVPIRWIHAVIKKYNLG